ncbi:efflux RND transporter periplasmic adaptor subunit [Gammaproteobacteria bacterium]|nr:efflux RND transporter periplasmic adaptor subunit [Gammaproteobacteria bacterium]
MDSIQQKIISRTVLATVAVITILMATKPSIASTDVDTTLLNIEVVKIHCGMHPKLIKLYGKVVASSPENIDSQLSSNVVKVYKKTGDIVSKGEQLLILDSEKLEQQRIGLVHEIKRIEERLEAVVTSIEMEKKLLQHQEQLLQRAQEELARYDSLSDAYQSESTRKNYADAVSLKHQQVIQHQKQLNQLQQQFSSDKNTRHIALTRLAHTEIDLEQTEIISPIDGVVQKMHISKGDVVSPGSALYTIIDPNHVYINAYAPAQYLPDLNTNTSIAYLDNAAMDKLQLKRISQMIQAGSAHLDAHYVFEGKTPKLALGQTVSILAEIPLAVESCPVPESSIYQDRFVYQITDQALMEVKINHLGLTYQDGQTMQLISAPIDNELILKTRLSAPKTGLRVQYE